MKKTFLFAAIFIYFFSNFCFAINNNNSPNKKIIKQVVNTINKVVPQGESALQKRTTQEQIVLENPLGIVFYEPNYVMPFYYTAEPFQDVGATPDGQPIMKKEFKAQISFLIPFGHNIFNSQTDLNFSFTQLFYWQFYAKSQYFRETNYAPAVFLTRKVFRNTIVSVGAVHQSNGRGGQYERSWNRFFMTFQISGKRWILNIKPWFLIYKNASSNLHNPDISTYLGHEEIVFAYKIHRATASIMVRNIEHPYTTYELNMSFPITKHINGYAQLFSGYGQSLIEYKHHTNSLGIGISLSNWI